MEKRVFKLGDVINVYIGMSFFEQKLDGMFKLTSFLVGKQLTRQPELRQVSRQCADHIWVSLPCFATDEMADAIRALHSRLNKRGDNQLFLTLWLAEREKVCGKFCELTPILERND